MPVGRLGGTIGKEGAKHRVGTGAVLRLVAQGGAGRVKQAIEQGWRGHRSTGLPIAGPPFGRGAGVVEGSDGQFGSD